MLFDYKVIRAGLVFVTSFSVFNALAHKIHDPTEPMFVIKKDVAAGEPQVAELAPVVAAPVFPQADIQLQGIFKKKDRTVAIISGQLYAIGDQISGYKINEINQDNIVLIGSGTQKRLYVYE